MADRNLAATITIGGSVDSSLGKAFGSVTKGAKGIGAELKAISQQTKELEKMVKELKAAGKSTAELEKRLAGLYRTQASMRARQGRLQAIGGMLHSGGGLSLGPTGSLIARGLASSERFGPATVSALEGVGAAAPFVAATATAVAAVAAAGIAATAAVIALGNAAGKFIDDTADIADGLGLTSTHLLGLQYAAAQSGIDADKLNEKIGKMTLSLESAKDGTGPTADALKELGLTWEELSVMNPESQVTALAEAFKTYNGNVPKVSIANAIFGKNSARFVNLLNQGRDGIRGMMKDARDGGSIITEEQEKQAQRYDAVLSKVGIQYRSIWVEIGSKVMPVVSDMLEKISNWLSRADVQAGFKRFGDALVPVMKTLGDNLPMLMSYFEKVLWVVTKVLEAFEATAKWSRNAGETIGGWFFDNSSPGIRPIPQSAPATPYPASPIVPIRAPYQTGDGTKPPTPGVLQQIKNPGSGPAPGKVTEKASANTFSFTINGATGANTYELMEEARRWFRDTQPQHVGVFA